MSDYLNTFFFGIYPYLAVGVMILGSLLRYDRDPYSWKADSSQLVSRKGLRWGSNLFHVGILLLFFGVAVKSKIKEGFKFFNISTLKSLSAL